MQTLDKTRICELLETDKLEESLELVKQYAHHESVMLKSRIAQIRRTSGLGITSPEEEGKIRQRIVKAVLDWLDEQS